MVKHIVIWKLKEGQTVNGAFARLDPMFSNLSGKIEGLLKVELGKNYNGGEFDLVLYTEFVSKEAEAFYQTHPLHLEIKEVVHSLVSGRACVDYEII